jgi:hypothetical protein
MGLASEGTSGGPLKGGDDMDRSGTSNGARVESSGRTDLRGVEDMVLGEEPGRRRNEGSQCSEGVKKSGGGQTNKEDRSLISQPDTDLDLTKSRSSIVAVGDAHPPHPRAVRLDPKSSRWSGTRHKGATCPGQGAGSNCNASHGSKCTQEGLDAEPKFDID